MTTFAGAPGQAKLRQRLRERREACNGPMGLAIDSQQKLYVADIGQQRDPQRSRPPGRSAPPPLFTSTACRISKGPGWPCWTRRPFDSAARRWPWTTRATSTSPRRLQHHDPGGRDGWLGQFAAIVHLEPGTPGRPAEIQQLPWPGWSIPPGAAARGGCSSNHCVRRTSNGIGRGICRGLRDVSGALAGCATAPPRNSICPTESSQPIMRGETFTSPTWKTTRSARSPRRASSRASRGSPSGSLPTRRSRRSAVGTRRQVLVDRAAWSSPGTPLAVDPAGNFFVADQFTGSIRKVTPAGNVTTFLSQRFLVPQDIALDKAGNLYVCDTGRNQIDKVTPSGVVSVVAAGQSQCQAGSTDGPGSTALFNAPSGIVVDSTGNIYVADTNNDAIRKITSVKARSAPLAGWVGRLGNTDGTGSRRAILTAARPRARPDGQYRRLRLWQRPDFARYAQRRRHHAGRSSRLRRREQGGFYRSAAYFSHYSNAGRRRPFRSHLCGRIRQQHDRPRNEWPTAHGHRHPHYGARERSARAGRAAGRPLPAGSIIDFGHAASGRAVPRSSFRC